MDLSRSLSMDNENSEVKQRLAEFMKLAGYREVTENNSNRQEFQRGSRIGSFLSFDPKHWQAKVIVNLRTTLDWATQAEINFHIANLSQIITKQQHFFWQNEMSSLARFLETGAGPGDSLALNTGRSGNVNMIRAIIVLVSALSVFLLFSIVLKDSNAGWIGLFFGLVIGVIIALLVRPNSRTKSSEKSTATSAAHRSNLSEIFKKDIRSWGGWLIFSGVLALIASTYLNATWGVILILVGLGSFLFRTPALYIVYATNLLWAAVTNFLLSDAGGWKFYSLLQLFIISQVIKSFIRYNRAYQAGKLSNSPAVITEGSSEAGNNPSLSVSSIETLPADPKANYLPWISLVLGVLGLTGFLVTFAVGVIISLSNNNVNFDVFGALVNLMTYLCLVAFGCGLGALLVRHRFKGASITGIVTGGLGTALYIAMLFL